MTAPTRLLYVDDDPGICRLVARALSREGYAVETAANGPSAVNRLEEGGIDVVALDHYMPGQDGLETLVQVRRGAAPPPVVFVTGSQEPQIAVAALKAGAADYVVKDVQGDFIPLLKAALENALTADRLRAAKQAAEADVREARDRFAALAAEREVLLREVNHRVGNSLQLIASLLHLQASGTKSADVKAALANATSRVMAVAQVHKRLYTSHDVQSVSVDQYLQAMVEDLRRSSDVTGMASLSLQAEPIEIDPDRAVAIGVIVNELVMNALKYAYPEGQGPIRIRLRAEPGLRARLSVEDDGVGAAGERQPNSTGLGQRIVEAMAAKLGADIAVDPSHAGTRVVLAFDLARSSSPLNSEGGAH